MNLSALLFDVARRVPRELAVSDNRQSLSYSELAERITRLAGGLRAYGASSWRPRAAGARELQRVLRTVVRVLDGRAMRGSDQCPIASARGRIHRGKFGRAVAGRDANLGRGSRAAGSLGRFARTGDLDA